MNNIEDFIKVIESNKVNGDEIEKVHLRQDVAKRVIESLERGNNNLIPLSNTIASYPIVVDGMDGPEYAIVFKNK